MSSATPIAEETPKGWLTIAVIGGVPLQIHWSLPFGGLLVACAGGVDPAKWIYYALGYHLVVIAHEGGHLLAGYCLGLKVYAVKLSGSGGSCLFERPRGVWSAFFLYSAGLLAQCALLLMTIAYLQWYGRPSGNLGRALVNTFILINVVLFVMNIVPSRTVGTRRATDGSVLWRLLLHRFFKRPHPLPSISIVPPDEAPIFAPETRLIDIPSFRPQGFVQGIEIFNDRKTPMEFVISVFMTHLRLSKRDATLKMLDVHNNGGIVIAIPSRDEALKIAAAISADAQAAGHPFSCRFAEV